MQCTAVKQFLVEAIMLPRGIYPPTAGSRGIPPPHECVYAAPKEKQVEGGCCCKMLRNQAGGRRLGSEQKNWGVRWARFYFSSSDGQAEMWDWAGRRRREKSDTELRNGLKSKGLLLDGGGRVPEWI